MFNVRMIKYANTGYQVRLYDSVIGAEIFEDVFQHRERDPDINDGDSTLVFMGNPFTGELEWVQDLNRLENLVDSVKDAERSAKSSMARSKSTVFYLARSNFWEYMITLTFNPQLVDSFDYEAVTKKLSKWLNNAKRKCPNLKYIVVPELHESGRIHFHGLIANCDGFHFTDSGKTFYSKDTKKREPIFNIDEYRLGWVTATMVVNNEKVCKYITKYITKEVCLSSKGKKRYWCSKNLERAEIVDTLMTFEEKEEFLRFFADDISHIKHLGSMDLGFGVTYVELKKGVEFDL